MVQMGPSRYGATKKFRQAKIFFQQGKYSEAEELFQQAADQRERTLGQDHKDTLSSKYSLGVALYSQKKYSQAEELFQQAANGRERTLGRNHMDTLASSYLFQELQSILSPISASCNTGLQAVGPRLSSFFSNDSNRLKTYTDSEVNEISLLLKQHHPAWSRVPRTYIVLRNTGHLDILDELIDADFSDYCFPVNERSLPGHLLELKHCS
jgi:tetratricopeptide (TPR) repeat protein